MASFIATLLNLLAFLIIARALVSWFPNARSHPVVQILFQLTDPIMLPLSRLNLRIGMFDMAPMVAVIVLITLARIIQGS